MTQVTTKSIDSGHSTKDTGIGRVEVSASPPEPVDDLAGAEYWQRNWKNNDFRHAIDPVDRTLNNYVNVRFDRLFRHIFKDTSTWGKKLIELGCGSSEWLPYFAKQFGFTVTGLDYSSKGCELASKILAAERVNGRVFEGDLFSPPKPLRESFDVAVSFGVVEHFTDTAKCLKAISDFVVRGGHLITVIPNMNGIPGLLQRWLSKAVYEKHVSMDCASLNRAHRLAGLKVIDCRYFLACNLGVINIESWKNRRRVHATAVHLRSGLSKLVWLLEPRAKFVRPNRYTSPYIVCHAVRDSSGQEVG